MYTYWKPRLWCQFGENGIENNEKTITKIAVYIALEQNYSKAASNNHV